MNESQPLGETLGSPGRMKRGTTELETCELNGWGIGSRLIGDEGYGPTVIEVTYFTRQGQMLAITESRDGCMVNEREGFWTLSCREWTEAARATDPAALGAARGGLGGGGE